MKKKKNELVIDAMGACQGKESVGKKEDQKEHVQSERGRKCSTFSAERKWWGKEHHK